MSEERSKQFRPAARKDLRALSKADLAPLETYAARIAQTVATAKGLSPETHAFLQEKREKVRECFAKAFTTGFSGGFELAAVVTADRARKNIALGKGGVNYQLGEAFRGDPAFTLCIRGELIQLYAQFANDLQQQVAPAGSATRSR